MKRIIYLYLIVILALIALTACQFTQKAPLELARSTENSVEVIITLVRADDGQVYLTATFKPVESKLHLYSKDIPKDGIEGLGRPALLELPPTSAIKASGQLTANVSAQNLQSAPQGLQVYPTGAVTLSLPVILPAGTGWLKDEVIVTYMACTEFNCRPPVEGKVIPIQIPENDAFN